MHLCPVIKTYLVFTYCFGPPHACYALQVCVRGRCVFIGYLGNEELSSEVIDQDGWFHSGDIGKIDKV